MSITINGTTGFQNLKSLTISTDALCENISTDSLQILSTDVVGLNSSYRNKVINGNFDIWQRATSQTTSGYGSVDRWSVQHAGSTKTHSQQLFPLGQTEVPGNPKYFSRTVVSSVAGVNNYVANIPRIESVRTLAGKTATLSFYAKADANRNMVFEIYRSYGTGGTPSPIEDGICVTTFALTTTWQKYTVTVEIPSISGKTLGTDGNDFLAPHFWFDAGTNFNSRTNSLGHQSGTFDIAQVQLEEGSIATPFEEIPESVELSRCQRYYEQFSYTSSTYALMSAGLNVITNSWTHVYYKQTKRSTPTFTLLNGSWINITPANIIPGLTYATFGGTNFFYLSGTANLPAFSFSAEI